MSEIKVATRYAKALIDLSIEQNALEQIKEDVELFNSVLKENSELQAVLKNPVIGPDKKLGILDAIFGGKVHATMLSFFKIMANKGRGEILYVTSKEFITQYNILKGIFKAQVTSAAALSEENKEQIKSVVKQAVNGEVMLECKVDPDLIGGFVLKVGDKQFDASISHNLNRLKKDFQIGVA